MGRVAAACGGGPLKAGRSAGSCRRVRGRRGLSSSGSRPMASSAMRRRRRVFSAKTLRTAGQRNERVPGPDRRGHPTAGPYRSQQSLRSGRGVGARRNTERTHAGVRGPTRTWRSRLGSSSPPADLAAASCGSVRAPVPADSGMTAGAYMKTIITTRPTAPKPSRTHGDRARTPTLHEGPSADVDNHFHNASCCSGPAPFRSVQRRGAGPPRDLPGAACPPFAAAEPHPPAPGLSASGAVGRCRRAVGPLADAAPPEWSEPASPAVGSGTAKGFSAPAHPAAATAAPRTTRSLAGPAERVPVRSARRGLRTARCHGVRRSRTAPRTSESGTPSAANGLATPTAPRSQPPNSLPIRPMEEP